MDAALKLAERLKEGQKRKRQKKGVGVGASTRSEQLPSTSTPHSPPTRADLLSSPHTLRKRNGRWPSPPPPSPPPTLMSSVN